MRYLYFIILDIYTFLGEWLVRVLSDCLPACELCLSGLHGGEGSMVASFSFLLPFVDRRRMRAQSLPLCGGFLAGLSVCGSFLFLAWKAERSRKLKK